MRQLLFDLSSDPNLTGVGVYYHVPTAKIEVLKYESVYYPTRNYQTTSTHVGKDAPYRAFEGAVFIIFRGISSFPFVEKLSIDITMGQTAQQPFVDGFEIYGESAPGANDGRLIVHARSNKAKMQSGELGNPLTYSLDGTSYQVSNIFENIVPGTYTVRVKSNRIFSYDIVIPGYPLYNAQWVFTYKDRAGRDSAFVIEKLGYKGVLQELKQAAANPVTLRFGKSGDDRYTVIKGGEAALGLYAFSQYQFEELFSCHERQYRVSFYKGTALVFQGFILPDIYQEPYIDTPYPVNVSASDGLATLNSAPFAPGGYKPYGRKSLLQVLALCLAQTGLQLGIITSIHTYEERHAFEDADDPLTQTFVDTESYQGLMCAEVIERILKPFRARVRQWMGSWIIEEVGVSINKPRIKAWRGRETDAYCEGGSPGGVAWRGRESDAYCEQG